MADSSVDCQLPTLIFDLILIEAPSCSGGFWDVEDANRHNTLNISELDIGTSFNWY